MNHVYNHKTPIHTSIELKVSMIKADYRIELLKKTTNIDAILIHVYNHKAPIHTGVKLEVSMTKPVVRSSVHNDNTTNKNTNNDNNIL